jgi:hypothetical protein
MVKRRALKRGTRLLAAIAFAAYVASAVLTGPAYSRGWICTRCGEIVFMREYRLPLTPMPLYRSYGRQATRLSSVVRRHALAPNHSDDLVFVQGGGRSLFAPMCELGNRHMLLMVVNDGYIAAFIDNVFSYTDQETAQAWLDRIMSLDSPTQFDVTLVEAGFPARGFSTPQAFLSWWHTNQPKFAPIPSSPQTSP